MSERLHHRTVFIVDEVHKARIMGKLGARNLAELIRITQARCIGEIR